jgi:hypothetical protein
MFEVIYWAHKDGKAVGQVSGGARRMTRSLRTQP